MNYSKGISWIDDCRIPFVDEKVPRLNVAYEHKTNNNFGGGNDKRFGTSTMSQQTTQGRFPANILVSDDMLNDGVISKSNDHKWEGEDTSLIYGKYENRTRTQVYSDKGSNSRYYDIDKWFEKLLDV